MDEALLHFNCFQGEKLGGATSKYLFAGSKQAWGECVPCILRTQEKKFGEGVKKERLSGRLVGFDWFVRISPLPPHSSDLLTCIRQDKKRRHLCSQKYPNTRS